MLQWLNAGPLQNGFQIYTYPITFDRIFTGVHGWCSSFGHPPTLNSISFTELYASYCTMYTDVNKQYVYAILIGY